MSQLGVGSFLQGLMSGYKTADDMRLKQEELNLTKVKIEQAKDEEKRKKDKDTLELQMKLEEQDAKRIKELNESFESDSVKDINFAVGSYNSKADKFGIDSRKAVMTDQDGKQYVTDFTADTINGAADIQASLSNKDGMYIFKNNYLHSKNPDTGEYVRTNNFGQSVENIKKAYEIKQLGTGGQWVKGKDGKSIFVTNEVAATEGLEKWKEPQAAPQPTESDKEYSSYVSHQNRLGLPVLDRYEYKQESKGGKIDATYQAKFDNAYNKLKQDNPDMNETDLRNAADEAIRSTQSERVSNKIVNMEKAINTKLKTNNILDANITEVRKDKGTAKLLDDYFIEKAKDKFGSTWQDDVKSASTAVANADKVFDAGSVYAKDIIDGKSGINVVNRLFDNTVGSYINNNITSEEKLNASKDLASIMNVVRHEQYGAVVPLAEQVNFNDAATNLAKSSPDIVRGTISMIKQEREKMQTAKDILGTELFAVKFGDKIDKLDDKINILESALKSNSTKPTNTSNKKKSLSEIFNK